MPFNICLIGCGWVAEACHGPALRKYAAEQPDTVLSACCDLDSARAEAFRQTFGFLRSYGDYKEMLANEKADALCLLVNERHICPISIEIFSMGIPLLLEKPPGLNLAETSEMAEAAARHKVPHTVAFNRRHAPIMQMLKEEMADLPAVQRYHYELLRMQRTEPDFAVTAIHAIDALRHIAGADYRHIDFTYQDLPAHGHGVANIMLECRMTNGASAGILIAPMGGINAERGQILADGHHIEFSLPVGGGADGELRHYENNVLTGEATDSGEAYLTQGFYEENRAFFAAVRAGQVPEHGLETALQSVAVTDCLRARKICYEA